MTRSNFRRQCVERDGGQCVVPSCYNQVNSDPDGPGEVHHIIERKLWEDGGYIPQNGACVCNKHHRYAEENIIPPQAFWRWIEGVPALPEGYGNPDIDKWGESLEQPSWQEHREYIKYPSTRHLPFSHEREADDTAHQTLDWLMDYPLVATIKMDGGNCMLVKDSEDPIRARNGRHADREYFDMAKQWYWENGMFEEIPRHFQLFGEWLYAKHSIHYGCDCRTECDDVGPAPRDYFQLFGVYDTRYNLWLGWHETEQIANELGLSLVPPADPSGPHVYGVGQFDNPQQAWEYTWQLSQDVVERGHEGIVVRSALPFHYGQIERRLGKYVRPGHVTEGEKHWSNRPLVRNNLQ